MYRRIERREVNWGLQNVQVGKRFFFFFFLARFFANLAIKALFLLQTQFSLILAWILVSFNKLLCLFNIFSMLYLVYAYQHVLVVDTYFYITYSAAF